MGFDFNPRVLALVFGRLSSHLASAEILGGLPGGRAHAGGLPDPPGDPQRARARARDIAALVFFVSFFCGGFQGSN